MATQYNFFKSTHYVPASHPRKSSTTKSPGQRLLLVVNEYRTSETACPNLTLLLTHGTSFCKEIWEPIIEYFLRPGGPVRDVRIIAVDAANHGDSAVVNKSELLEETHWPDHSRDILQVVQYFEPHKQVLAIGHSFGGGTLAHASEMLPEKFIATILVEPILFQMREQTKAVAERALKRRDQWRDLAEVRSSFATNRGMSEWTAAQRENYAVHGTVADTRSRQSTRRLKTPKQQEAANYLAGPFPEIIALLKNSRSRRHFILGGRSEVLNQECRETIQEVARGTGEVTIIQDASHLIPHTHPALLGELLEGYLTKVLSESSVPKSVL